MAASTLTTKGQITIPKEVRDRLGVREGDRVVFQFDEQDRLILRPESSDPLKGILGLLHDYAKDRPVTVAEMKADVLAKAVEKYGGRKPS